MSGKSGLQLCSVCQFADIACSPSLSHAFECALRKTNEPTQKKSSGFLFSSSIASQGIFLLFPSRLLFLFFIRSLFVFFSYFPFFSSFLPITQCLFNFFSLPSSLPLFFFSFFQVLSIRLLNFLVLSIRFS
jgi:hypothetical protein